MVIRDPEISRPETMRGPVCSLIEATSNRSDCARPCETNNSPIRIAARNVMDGPRPLDYASRDPLAITSSASRATCPRRINNVCNSAGTPAFFSVGYSAEIAVDAKSEAVPLLDLNELIAARYDPLGEEAVTAVFADKKVHTSKEGAQMNAAIVIGALASLPKNPAAPYLRPKPASVW